MDAPVKCQLADAAVEGAGPALGKEGGISGPGLLDMAMPPAGAAGTGMDIPQLLMDEYNLKILSSTYYTGKSVRQLAYLFDIPIATCYRKIKELEDVGLLKCIERPLTRDGRRYKIYKSELMGIKISFERGKLRIRIELMYKTPIEFEQNPEGVRTQLNVPLST
jgi:hypothetical protein